MNTQTRRYVDALEQIEALGADVHVHVAWTGSVYVDVSHYNDDTDELTEVKIRVSDHYPSWYAETFFGASDFYVFTNERNWRPAELRDAVARVLGFDPSVFRKPIYYEICGIKARTYTELARKLARRFPELGEPVPGSPAIRLAIRLWDEMPIRAASEPIEAEFARKLGYHKVS